MVAIVKELTIAADPERVYSALTQQNELARWWTNELSAKPEVGSLAEFRFREGAFVLQLEIAELDAEEKVFWKSRQGTAGWAGTSITWQLTPVQQGTQVLFTHAGFARADVAYEQIRGTWEYFLGSLQSYLETGKGTPGVPSH
ncbi:MAG TPA: SRPBCC domain-containing protein [Ktedonobacteraceae bacterium]|jgi:uncharacterized protein YndB with AHSA1/START domain